MTKQLYYDSAYLKQWDTNILETVQKDEGFYVVLEETAFYPHGGGQPCDLGMIQGIPVLDVVLEEDKILHKIESIPAASRVSCSIEWDRRFDHMQHHSGQHLLSAVCLEMYDMPTLSFHLGNDYCTIDVEAKELSTDQLESIEREVNRQIYLNHQITSYWVNEEEVQSIKLVKQPKVTENIRIVEIKDVEFNACGGTHVSATGQIGMIKLLKAEKQKGNIRIYFKCGYRALEEFNLSQRILGALSAKFKTGKDEILQRIEKWEHEQKELQTELALLREENIEFVAKQMLSSQEGHIISAIFENKTMKELQSLAGKLTSQNDAFILLATKAENKIVLAHNNQLGQSCGAIFKSHLSDFNGKGGGSDLMAQAGFPTWEEVYAFYEFTAGKLRALYH